MSFVAQGQPVAWCAWTIKVIKLRGCKVRDDKYEKDGLLKAASVHIHLVFAPCELVSFCSFAYAPLLYFLLGLALQRHVTLLHGCLSKDAGCTPKTTKHAEAQQIYWHKH